MSPAEEQAATGSRWRWWPAATAGAALVLSGYLRWRAHPVAFDDAFISFRYAHNLVTGHGLVNLEFDHPRLTECSNPRRQNRAQVFVRLERADECVRAYYLTPTPALTQLFCTHPEHFVLHEVDCSRP